MPTLGERLREERQARSLTQREVSELVTVARDTYAGWEIGRSNPDLETIVKLADAFMVSTDFLLGRTDERGATVAKVVTVPLDEEAVPVRFADRDLEMRLRRLADREGQSFPVFLSGYVEDCAREAAA
jgi:transcriptional regulator with XRE-family HTH domain